MGIADELVDVHAGDAEVQRGLLQPRAVAFRTGDHVREAFGPVLGALRTFLRLFQDEGDDAFELDRAIAQAHVARSRAGARPCH